MIVFLQTKTQETNKKLIGLLSNKISMFGFYKLFVLRMDITGRESAVIFWQMFYNFKKNRLNH